MYKSMSRTIILGTLFVIASFVSGQDQEDVPCTDNYGRTGVCLRYFQCKKDNTFNIDGEDIISVRFASGCAPLHVCCGSDDVVKDAKPPKYTDVKPTECGIINPNGVNVNVNNGNNNDAQFGEFPWMVAIFREEDLFEGLDDQKILQYNCGGSLIHPKVVVSSVHNILTSNYIPYSGLIARAGEWDQKVYTEPQLHQDIRVKTIIMHPGYQRDTYIYDISLLILKTSMILTQTVNPICLPDTLSYPSDKNCISMGWGKNKFSLEEPLRTVLKKVKLPFVNKDTCQTLLRRTRLRRFFQLHDSFVCAGGEVNQDPCTGDGGSPLACPVAGRTDQYYLTGIVSWGIGCGDKDVPGVYTDVTKLKQWITSELDDHNITL